MPLSSSPSSSRRLLLLAGALVVAAGLLGGPNMVARIPELAQVVASAGIWGPLLFIGVYTVATLCLVPGSLLTLAAGALFGLGQGIFVVFLGALLGSTLAFLTSRYLARSTVESRLSRHARFAAVDRAIAQDGLRIVFLLRLSPIFPFALLNYALGLTRVRIRDYVLAGFGMLPGTMLYVYYGKLAGDVAALAGGIAAPKGAGYWVVLSLGLLATVLVTGVVTRHARAALHSATEDSAEGISKNDLVGVARDTIRAPHERNR